MNYDKIYQLMYECNCTQMSKRKWDSYMADAKIGNKAKINKLVKVFLPDLYEELALDYPNPYTYYRTDTHLIVVHSAIEYFLEYRKPNQYGTRN